MQLVQGQSMSNKTTINHIWWQLAIFVIVSSAAAIIGVHFKEKFSRYVPETLINPSVLNKKASGSSGLYELSKVIGLRSHLWKLPYRDLREIHGQLVIIGPRESLAKFEIESILQWVNKGNDLVYLDRFSNPYSKDILTLLALSTKDPGPYQAGPHTDVPATPNQDLTVTKFVRQAKVSFLTCFNANTNCVPVLQYDQNPVLVEMRYGAGRILIGTTANLLANTQLTESADNFQLIGNWLRFNDRDVYFDERCHGLTQSKNLLVTALSGTSGILFVQLFIIFGLAIAGSAQRFGQTIRVTNPRKISNLEFVHGIANSYRRAKATHLASEVLSHNLRLKLARALGQSTGDDYMLATIYIDSLEPANKTSAEMVVEKSRLIKTLSRSKEPGKFTTNISYQELAEISAYCDKIQETINQKRQAKV